MNKCRCMFVCAYLCVRVCVCVCVCVCLCVYCAVCGMRCAVWVRVACIVLLRTLVYFIAMHAEHELLAYPDPVMIPS